MMRNSDEKSEKRTHIPNPFAERVLIGGTDDDEQRKAARSGSREVVDTPEAEGDIRTVADIIDIASLEHSELSADELEVDLHCEYALERQLTRDGRVREVEERNREPWNHVVRMRTSFDLNVVDQHLSSTAESHRDREHDNGVHFRHCFVSWGFEKCSFFVCLFVRSNFSRGTRKSSPRVLSSVVSK